MATDGRGEGFTFVWRIENFSLCAEKEGEYIKSPEFFAQGSYRTYLWQLYLFPRYESNKIGCKIYKMAQLSMCASVFVDYELSFLASDESSYQAIMCKACRFREDILSAGELLVSSRANITKMKTIVLPNDILTVRCRIWHAADRTVEKKFARTRIGVDSWLFSWTKKDFSDSSTKNETISVKSIDNASYPSWNIQVIKFHESLGDEYVRFDITIQSDKMKLAIFKAVVINSENKSLDFAFNQQYASTDHVWSVFSHFTKKKMLQNFSHFLPNNTLTLKCELIISAGVVSNYLEDIDCETSFSFMKSNTETKDCCCKVPGQNSNGMLTGLQFLYREWKLCDSSLRTKSGTFPVHKTVLGAMSSVFCTMFENNMMEQKTNVIDVLDLDDDTVKRMLDFIYTDTIDALEWESASKLYYAADKYGLLSLKKKCSSFFQATVDVSNVCQTLVLADMHHDQDLATNLVNFISEHHREVFHSEDWRSLENSNCKLANKTLRFVIVKHAESPESK